MVEGYSRPVGVHFLPEDREVVDRALVTGRSLAELGESRLRTSIGELATATFRAEVAHAPSRRSRFSRRVAG
jgi:hypothetical protein